MIRSFLPVGQGAFYCECFGEDSDVKVVYDCGSSTDKNIVEREIRSNFRKGEKIDAVFISHLHEDHINGIPFLLKHCEVKRIYLPLITQESRMLMKVRYYIDDIHGFSHDFLTDPFEAVREISPESQLFLVRAEGEQEIVGLNIPIVESGRNISVDIGEDNFPKPYKQWLYIPFNFRQRSRIKILLDNLEKLFGREIKVKELENLWRNGSSNDRDKITKAYEKVPGGLNTNSMTLFSGVEDDTFRQYKYSCCSPRYNCFWRYNYQSAGCLFMGDYDASGKSKWAELIKAYQKYWEQIGCVQIPHHGSCHNFNDGFLDMDVFFVVSAGYANRYRHPHGSVLKKLLMTCHVPDIVTEWVGSAVHFRIQ